MSFPPSFAPSSVGKESACNAEVRTWVLFLDREDPLEKEMATHSNILDWESHGQRNLVGYGPWGRKSRTRLSEFHYTICHSDYLIAVFLK